MFIPWLVITLNATYVAFVKSDIKEHGSSFLGSSWPTEARFFYFFEKNAIISKISTKNGFPDMQKNAENVKQLKRTNKHISR